MMEDWQERVVVERDRLNMRVQKLQEFIGGEQLKKLNEADRSLLVEQSCAMVLYLCALDRRIAGF